VEDYIVKVIVTKTLKFQSSQWTGKFQTAAAIRMVIYRVDHKLKMFSLKLTKTIRNFYAMLVSDFTLEIYNYISSDYVMAANIKKGQGEKNAKAKGLKSNCSDPACGRHDNGHSRMQFQHAEQSSRYRKSGERTEQQYSNKHPRINSDDRTQKHKPHQCSLVSQ